MRRLFMKPLSHTVTLGVALAAVLAVALTSASAEDWPTRPVRVISPYPAGSASDTVTRVVLDQVSQRRVYGPSLPFRDCSPPDWEAHRQRVLGDPGF